jgi:hypothetical protein
MRCDEVVKKLKAMADPVMAEYKYNRGCRAQICYGIKVCDLRKIAFEKETKISIQRP